MMCHAELANPPTHPPTTAAAAAAAAAAADGRGAEPEPIVYREFGCPFRREAY